MLTHWIKTGLFGVNLRLFLIPQVSPHLPFIFSTNYIFWRGPVLVFDGQIKG